MSALPPILILHNRYRQVGGEEGVVAAEAALLRDAGHAVHLREWDNHSIGGVASQTRTFLAANGNPEAARWLRREIAEAGAGIVHVHNFFPLLSPAVHRAATQAGCAVVQTLHNYRLLCAAATFLREGAVCRDCVEHGRHHALLHRCYRGSLAGSLASVRMQRAAIGDAGWRESVHRFVALTQFAREQLVAGGLPSERTVVKGNFLSSPAAPMKESSRKGALYVGRLSHEKGVEALVAAWHDLPAIPLTIMGTGPLEDSLRAAAPGNVTFTGHGTSDDVAKAMGEAAMLVMPSVWYEGFPLTMVEAFARGLPVIASDIGSLSEIAGGGEYAGLFRCGDTASLAEAVRALAGDPEARERLAGAASAAYDRLHTADRNRRMLEIIYREACDEAGVR